MSTSLKIQYADEIAEAMAQALGNDFIKTAGGSALMAYQADLANAKDENDLKLIWNKHMDALNQEESTDEALKLQAEKAHELGLHGYATPGLADDKDVCELCGQKIYKDDELPVEEEEPELMACDGQTTAAANFAMNHLVRIADALDGKGFGKIANVIDKTLEKLAKYKM